MRYLDTIFGYYDTVISPLSPAAQALISFLLLLFLIWQIWQIFKSGHWIFIAALIILFPVTWPAAIHIANLIILVIKFLLIRIQIAF
jgi:hypothetical protein